jgi:hypothetical protein
MMMIVEQSVECELAVEIEVLGENPNPGRRGGKLAINRLSYGTADARLRETFPASIFPFLGTDSCKK